VSTTSTGRLFHREGAAKRRRMLAWQVQCAFSARSGAACWKVAASVTGCDRSAANLGTAVMTSDEP